MDWLSEFVAEYWGIAVLVGGGVVVFVTFLDRLLSILKTLLGWLWKRPRKFSVPFRHLQPGNQDDTILALLQWQSRESAFRGRETELTELHDWADSPGAVSVKFITGEGGLGKSMLAAKFAKELEDQGWDAGFPIDANDLSLAAGARPQLCILDYPEEKRAQVAECFVRVARIPEGTKPIRVLALSRRPAEDWQDQLSGSVRAILAPTLALEPQPGGAIEAAAFDLFDAAHGEAARVLQTSPAPFEPKVFKSWLREDAHHQIPLFMVAAAIWSALHPDEPRLTFKGREIVAKLATREIEHRRRLAPGDPTLPLLLTAYAAMTGGLRGHHLDRIKECGGPPRIDDPGKAIDLLRQAGLWPRSGDGDYELPAARPDILGACMMVLAIRDQEKLGRAPDALWLGVELAGREGLPTMERLFHDAESVLRMGGDAGGGVPSRWLEAAVTGNERRSEMLLEMTGELEPTQLFLAATIAARRTRIAHAQDDATKALHLNNLSNDLSGQGKTLAALAAIEEAVKIRRPLARDNPARFAPDLASSLNNWSNALSAAGRGVEALAAIEEAVKIRRPLARDNPARFAPH